MTDTKDDSAFRIVVVGGGIAGLAAAIALRGPNRQVTVLEKSRMNREIGALISFQPNAQKIVQGWGLAPFLENAGPVADREFRILDVNGQIRIRIPLATEKYGADRMIYHRVDLHEAMKKAALSGDFPGPPVIIRTSSGVSTCDFAAGVVTLEDASTIEGDLIVAADGIRSTVRTELLKACGERAVEPLPTGMSAYRVLLDTKDIPELSIGEQEFHPSKPVTTLMMAYDRRVVIVPARSCSVLGLICLVPDKHMHENSNNNSWNAPGSIEELLQQYKDFPPWIRAMMERSPDVALWQLRDIDPLPTWIHGRAILIGDAAHAMLPLQGQGASQAVEDAEALQAYFADITTRPTRDQVEERLRKVFAIRHERASLIQLYSRQQASHATAKGETKVDLNPGEFMDYNCQYDGALDWAKRQQQSATAA